MLSETSDSPALLLSSHSSFSLRYSFKCCSSSFFIRSKEKKRKKSLKTIRVIKQHLAPVALKELFDYSCPSGWE